MPNLKPTRATALVFEDGTPWNVITDFVWRETDTRKICLIMPAPLPIAECPEEWKDGRRVMVKIHGWWVEVIFEPYKQLWMGARGDWYDEGAATDVTLPPPDPRGEEVKP